MTIDIGRSLLHLLFVAITHRKVESAALKKTRKTRGIFVLLLCGYTVQSIAQ